MDFVTDDERTKNEKFSATLSKVIAWYLNDTKAYICKKILAIDGLQKEKCFNVKKIESRETIVLLTCFANGKM